MFPQEYKLSLLELEVEVEHEQMLMSLFVYKITIRRLNLICSSCSIVSYQQNKRQSKYGSPSLAARVLLHMVQEVDHQR